MANVISNCNLFSRDVIVFPLSKDRISNPNKSVLGEFSPVDLNRTRLFTEKSVSNLIRQLIDVDGFVIGSRSLNSDNTLLEVEFNLAGYYFKINLDLDGNKGENNSVYSGWENIYASITIHDDYDEIVGQDDDDNVYTGLTLHNTPPNPPESGSIHTLHILTKSGGNWTIPTESCKRFSTFSLNITGIDGDYK